MSSLNTRTTLRSQDAGVAMILVLLAILVLTTLAAAMVFSARAEALASYNFRISSQAEFVARAGVQRAMNFFESSGSYVALIPRNPGGASGELIGVGSGGATTFTHTTALNPVARGTVAISATVHGSASTGTDDSSGNITGTDFTGTINYRTGYLSITFQPGHNPDNGTNVYISYATSMFYQVSQYATKPVSFYYGNAAPVQCTVDCSSGGVVALGTTSGSSVYPPPSATSGVDVVTNWVNAMSANTLQDGTGGSGQFTVTAKLLDYHTVNNAFYGVDASATCPADPAASLGICRQPYEVWQVTSTGNWSNGATVGAANPQVRLVATISPMYLPYFGNALYGLCSVSLKGTSICTDSYKSDSGGYNNGSGSINGCASPTSAGSNASATNAGVGANGGVVLSGSPHVGGNVTYADSPPAGCTTSGFSGNDSGIAGSVLPGPAVPTPPAPTMTGYPKVGANDLKVQAPKPTGSDQSVANVWMSVTTPPARPISNGGSPATLDAGGQTCATANAGAGGPYTAFMESYAVSSTKSGGVYYYTYYKYNCVGIPGAGTGTSAYEVGDVTASSSNPGTINFIAPTTDTLSNPAVIWMNQINTDTSGVVNTSYAGPLTPTNGAAAWNPAPPAPTTTNVSAISMDVYNSVTLAGTGDLNFNPATPGVPSPTYLSMIILGTGTALSLTGQAQISAQISCPNGDAYLKGSGANGVMFGSILAQNVTDAGNYPVHYDLDMRMASGKLYPIQVVSVSRPKM